MRYMIFIAFILLGAFTEKYYIISQDQQLQIAQANRTINLLENHYTKPVSYPYINPVHKDDYKQPTSPYGLREIPVAVYTGGAVNRLHEGIDISGTWKARIVAITDGEVIDNYHPPGNGWKGHPVMGGMIRIQHTDGRISVYGHLSATYVNETTKRFVKAGQIIGRMGNTGYSTGQHLHFELWENGVTLQPLKYIGGLND